MKVRIVGVLAATATCALVLLSVVVAACGGATEGSSSDEVSAAASMLSIDPLSSSVSSAVMTPWLQVMADPLDEPADVDVSDPSSSAQMRAATQTLRAMSLSGARLSAATVQPLSSGASAVITYTPAQIRAAYGLPALPSSWSGLTSAQLAQMGAGQTIYIIDAWGDPNISAELSAFSKKFGLPSCADAPISASSSLPLASPAAAECTFSVVYSTSGGGMTSVAPSYSSGWAIESALDVEWAHATAPLARLILIEAPSASTSNLLSAVSLANAMGPGVVSMSFGGSEGAWTSGVDSAFKNADMTYIAAAGDTAAEVIWPSVSPNVLAVGGTTLSYSAGQSRSEVAWSSSGGSSSVYTLAPAYQSPSVPGLVAASMRSTSDVSFNADPRTGQYVAVIAPGSSAATWYDAGGTSVATPQWAGLAALANAMRSSAGLARIGLLQPMLYDRIAVTSALYGADFLDVQTGSNGACGTCAAGTGYDHATGLGTPNAAALLSTLGSAASTQAPIVGDIAISADAYSPLAFSMSLTSVDAVSWSLVSAPAGMTVDSSGRLVWPVPVSGNYAVSVSAKDLVTGLSGTGVATISVVAPRAPTVSDATVSGTAGSALGYQLTVTSKNPVTFSLANAPTGMSVSTSGMLNWPSPRAGKYSMSVTATDNVTHVSGAATIVVSITSGITGPVISAPAVSAVAGTALNAIIGITDSTSGSVSVTIRGAPSGMSFRASGQSIIASWGRPVVGTYSLTITATDAAKISSQAIMSVKVTSP